MKATWLLVPALALATSAVLAADKLNVVDAFFEEADGRVTRNFELVAGETLYFTFKIANFRTDDRQRVRLSYTVACTDPNSVPVVESDHQKVEAALEPQDEHWLPKANWSVVIPSYAPSGNYRVRVRVEDEIGKATTEYDTSFKVRGETIPPADKLAVRQFEFADAEGGPPKPDNVFHRGSTLWARFKLVGFRISPDKQYWVEYDLAVLDSAGRVLYSKADAAVEKHKQFYPPRVLPSAFDLDLQTSARPGEYTIRLTVRDRLGEQNQTHEAKFRIDQ